MDKNKQIKKVADELLKANNTVTTLEIKTELRKRFPNTSWYQYDISWFMDRMFLIGEYDYTDTGSYRIYSFANVAANTPDPKPIKVKTPSKTQTISRNKAAQMLSELNGNKGRFFGVTFTKKDGSVRKMRCKIDPTAAPTQLGYINLIDVSKGEYRSVNLQTLSEVRLNKTVYKIK